MIRFEEIDGRLETLGKNRQWLAEITGRSEGSIRAALAPNSVPKNRTALLQKALSDAIEKEESAQRASVRLPDQLALAPTPDEFDAWDRASRAAKAETLKKWAIDELNKAAAAWSASKVISITKGATEQAADIIELPFLGAVAAGEPVSATLHETVVVPREYPDGHFVVEINGRSGEPQFMDGERWVIDGRDCFTPKKGKPCIVSDGYGSYLKKWNPKRQVFESINPEFNDVLPLAEAKLQGYPVAKL